MRVTLAANAQTAQIDTGTDRETLKLNEISRWLEVSFSDGRSTIKGICRFCVRSFAPHFSLYVSPINVHPEQPVLPISEPIYFSGWLSRLQGLYGTLGLMEDTWGRNELVLDDAAFLEQTMLTHRERERMFFETLSRTNEGTCICVFDASDRIQHMFWRYLEKDHPAPLEDDRFREVIPNLYQALDELVGKVKSMLRPDDLLIVMSDHGFASFRRCINLNSWLRSEGYLALKEGADPDADFLQSVDWTRTKAFGLGLSGMYLNRKGRERWGIVDESDGARLKKELMAKLEALRDPDTDMQPIHRVYDSERVYSGLYAEEAPDLIIGYEPGYRVSWRSVTGGIERDIYSDNQKAWSGDHQIDPSLIPGVIISSKPLTSASPHISDLAPTILDVFAVPVPAYMEGKVIL